ncbi:MAG TPA: ABC transporter substrate-binding protein [Methanocorpusculum sp.]|nr:ABC transporter substrate-binding protein [Methanocorpusculum sp.]
MNKSIKKLLKICLVSILLCSLVFATVAICDDNNNNINPNSSKTIKDDFGLNISVPTENIKITPTGPLAQMIIYSIDPTVFGALSSKLGGKKYINTTGVSNLEEYGRIIGGKDRKTNIEKIVNSSTNLIVDIGEDDVKSNLEELSKSTKIPVFHIRLNDMSNTSIKHVYDKLSEILPNRKEKCSELSNYLFTVVSEYESSLKNINTKKSMIYVPECDGNSINLLGTGTIHSKIIDEISNNIAPQAKNHGGFGDEYSIEKILKITPDYIIVAPNEDDSHNSYNSVLKEPKFKDFPAIKNKNVYEAPAYPYNWMGMPPSIQRVLSMIWLSHLMYPEVYGDKDDMKSKIMEFYEKIFHYNLSDTEYKELMVNSIPTTLSSSDVNITNNKKGEPTGGVGTENKKEESPAPIMGLLCGVLIIVGLLQRRS